MPGFVRSIVEVWQDITLTWRPLRTTLVLYLRDEVDIHDILLEDYRDLSIDCLYDVGRFPVTVFHNSIWPIFECS